MAIEARRPGKRQADYAVALGMSPSYLSAQLGGVYPMTNENFHKLLELLGAKKTYQRITRNIERGEMDEPDRLKVWELNG